jgi:hypothetical protein
MVTRMTEHLSRLNVRRDIARSAHEGREN